MKKFLIILSLMMATVWSANAQKLVIGSEIDEHAEVTDLQWLTDAPDPGKTWVIDFFSTKNPTAKKYYYENIDEIAKIVGDDAEIIIVTTASSDEFEALALSDGKKCHFAVDPNRTFHKLLGVEYIPYTVVVSAQGELLWQGNLSTAIEEFKP